MSTNEDLHSAQSTHLETDTIFSDSWTRHWCNWSATVKCTSSSSRVKRSNWISCKYSTKHEFPKI